MTAPRIANPAPDKLLPNGTRTEQGPPFGGAFMAAVRDFHGRVE